MFKLVDNPTHLEQLELIEQQIKHIEKVKKTIDATSQLGYNESTRLSNEIAKLKNQLYKLSLRVK